MRLFAKGDPMDVVEQALQARPWRYTRIDAQTVISGVTTPSGRHYLIAVRHEVERRTLLFLTNPVKGPADGIPALVAGRAPLFFVHPSAGHTADQVARVCEALMDENYRLLLGCHERDQSDGEIRYRIALPYRDTAITIEQVNWCVDVGVGTMEVMMGKLDGILAGAAGIQV